MLLLHMVREIYRSHIWIRLHGCELSNVDGWIGTVGKTYGHTMVMVGLHKLPLSDDLLLLVILLLKLRVVGDN